MTNTNLLTSAEHRTWRSFTAMWNRCTLPYQTGFANYGGRGITVCRRWSGSYGFERFLEDMGARPSGMSLDRIDVYGNYEPSNCRWATAQEQAKNKRPRKRKEPWPDY